MCCVVSICVVAVRELLFCGFRCARVRALLGLEIWHPDGDINAPTMRIVDGLRISETSACAAQRRGSSQQLSSQPYHEVFLFQTSRSGGPCSSARKSGDRTTPFAANPGTVSRG